MSDTWEALRVLDGEENWAERNEVLFKEEHSELVQFAKDILHDLVNDLPICYGEQEHHLDNFSKDFSPVTFDLDYLESLKMERCSDSNMLSRDSIYVKFDPLVAKVSHEAADAHADKPRARDKRILLGLDTPPHVLERIQPSNVKDCREVSQFSPDTEAIPTKDEVVKYSNEDLLKLAQLARRRANQRERQKIEAEMLKLKEMITTAHSQMQSHCEQVYILDSTRSTHLLHMDKMKEERRKVKEKVSILNQSIRERLRSYQELQGQKNNFESYQASLVKDKAQLESTFDELHSCHVKQKEMNRRLTNRIEEMEMYLTKVREWHRQASEQRDSLMRAKEAVQEEFKQQCEATQNEYEMKLAVERTKTKKLQLKKAALQDDLLLMKQDKEQLTQICDDLMKQLELNT